MKHLTYTVSDIYDGACVIFFGEKIIVDDGEGPKYAPKEPAWETCPLKMQALDKNFAKFLKNSILKEISESVLLFKDFILMVPKVVALLIRCT